MQLWTIPHFIYILSPFIILCVLYFTLRHKSEKTKYIVGAVIGALSLFVITVRMISYFVDYGFRPHGLPIQLCHFGNIVIFISLVFKSKSFACLGFGLHLFPAMFSIVYAESLTFYTFFYLRAQCYMWGHLLIVVGAIYPVMLKTIKFDRKSLRNAFFVMFALAIVSFFLNSLFNVVYDYGVNYFNLFAPDAFPLYKLIYRADYNVIYGGWLQVNWIYNIGVILYHSLLVIIFYFLEKLFYLKNKDYKTLNIFEERKLKMQK